jgi:TRAP transporter TAXI family solute receptor
MAFANIISKSIPELNIMSISTKGSIQNLDLLSSGDIKLCICQSDIAYDAITGKGLFEKNAQKDLKILMSLFPEVVQIATHKNSKIKNISDLKGKKIILGSLESGNSKTAQTLLSAFNISLNDIEPIFINYDEAIKTMITRRADAFILIAGLPTRVISELFSNNCINLLEFNSNEIDFLINKMNFFSKAIISTKTYTQLNQEISTVAINALLVSNINMSDITAHKIVKNILDNLQYIKTCHPRAADISIKSIYDSVPQGSMHTGTIEYLKSLKNTEKSY